MSRSKIILPPSKPYNTGTSFDPKSKKETVVISEGILRYTKVKKVSEVEGKKTINVPISKFRALRNIYKCAKSKVNWQRICDRGKTMYVIGLPTSEHDPNTYVVYSEDHGVFKREWNTISTKDGRRNLEYLGTDTTIFEVPMTGTYENEVCMVPLTKEKHVWVSSEWLERGSFNTAYAQDPQDDSFTQGDVVNESPEPATQAQAGEAQPRTQPPQEGEASPYSYCMQAGFGSVPQYGNMSGTVGMSQYVAGYQRSSVPMTTYQYPQAYTSSSEQHGMLDRPLSQNYVDFLSESPYLRCCYYIPQLPLELADPTQVGYVFQF